MKKILLLLLFASCADATTTRLSRVEGDFMSITSMLKMFKVNAGRYPTEEEGLAALVEKPATYPVDGRWSKTLDKIPVDPWGAPYRFVLLDGELGIYTTGKDGISHSKGNDPDDWNTWSENFEPAEPPMFPFNRSGAVALTLITVLGCSWLYQANRKTASPRASS